MATPSVSADPGSSGTPDKVDRLGNCAYPSMPSLILQTQRLKYRLGFHIVLGLITSLMYFSEKGDPLIEILSMPSVGFPDGSTLARQNSIRVSVAIFRNLLEVLTVSGFRRRKSWFKTSS